MNRHRHAVERYIFTGQDVGNVRWDPRTPAVARSIWADPSYRGRLADPFEGIEADDPTCPLYYAWLLGDEDEDAGTADLLMPFTGQDVPTEARRVALSFLGRCGKPELVPILREGLSDPAVADAALEGLYEYAGWGGPADSPLPSPIFDEVLAVRPSLQHDVPSRRRMRMTILAASDPERAVSDLTSRPEFASDVTFFGEALAVFAGQATPISRGVAIAWVERSEAKVATIAERVGLEGLHDKMTLDAARAPFDAWRLLGQRRHPGDAERFTRVVETLRLPPEKFGIEVRLAEMATDGLLEYHGLVGIDEDGIERRLEADGPDRLPEPLRLFAAAAIADRWVTERGFADYFEGDAGRYARLARLGFEVMALPEQAAVITEACETFGPAGPSENDEERSAQINAMNQVAGDHRERTLEKLNKRYDGCRLYPPFRFMAYQAIHADLFRPFVIDSNEDDAVAP